jgi:hypothetical protein
MRFSKPAHALSGCTILVLLVGCGDPATNDARGYTKAPLENPGVVIKGEGSSAMDSLGAPAAPRDTLIAAPSAAVTTTQ